MVTATATLDLGAIERLTRDLKTAAVTLSVDEARYLVDAYYALQAYRIRSHNQVTALGKSEEPHTVISWFESQTATLEAQIKNALDRWTDSQPMGIWSKGVPGIGPVLAAGLLAHIDIAKAPTAGHIWRFAGLDPTVTWRKGQKRPWNASLKVICWKIGESFVKVKGKENDLYGHLYAERKKAEWLRNLRGELAEEAKRVLEAKKIGKETEAYAYYSGTFALPPGFSMEELVKLALEDVVAFKKSLIPWEPLHGLFMLPPAHIHARAKRWAVKLFLSHWQAEAYRQRYGVEPPAPYPIAILGHAHTISPVIREDHS